jgi:protein-disulfide isomerase
MSENRAGNNKRQPQQAAQERAERMKWLRIIGLTALIALAAGGLVMWREMGERAAQAAVERPPSNRIGPPDAPAQIIEYSDFGCPACRDWHERGIKEQLLDTYGEQISFEFRHFPVITQQSPRAAEAAQCAGAQNAFWDYHDYLFEEARLGALAEEELTAYATAVGLDEDTFEECLLSGRYRESVRLDMRAAQEAGARGTPTFVVNGRQVFPSYKGLSEAVDAALGR